MKVPELQDLLIWDMVINGHPNVLHAPHLENLNFRHCKVVDSVLSCFREVPLKSVSFHQSNLQDVDVQSLKAPGVKVEVSKCLGDTNILRDALKIFLLPYKTHLTRKA